MAQPTTEGTAVVARDLVSAGVARGDEVVVACPEGGDLGPWVEEIGAAWVRVPMTRGPSRADLKAIVTVGRLMRSSDLVIAHSSKAGAVARLARWIFRLNVCLVFLPHGWSWLAGGRAASVYRTLERLLARQTTAIVCVSSTEAEEGRKVVGGGVELVVIANGVDLSELSSEQAAAPRSDAPLVVVVGRLSRQKGQDLAIRALTQMQTPHVRLRLVGDGPDLEHLERLASRMEVADRVEFLGRMPALPHLRSADVVLVPSRWEGLSLALLEAMGLDCAIVGTAEAGSGVLDGAGVVVSASEEQALVRELARACDALLADEELRESLGTRARRRVEERFGLEETLAAHQRLWSALVPSAPQTHLLWMEATPSGSAAHLHLLGTRRRLEAMGRHVGTELSDPRTSSRSTLGRLRRIGGLIRRGMASARPGTLIVRHHPLAAPVVWAWRRRGARVVLSVQGALADARTDGGRWASVLPVDWLSAWQLRHADALITVTQGLVEQLQEATGGSVPVALIPNGIQLPDQVEPVRRSRPYACFAGNLAAWQGIDLMFRAVQSERWPTDVDLVIIGDGALREQVESQTSDRIEYLGPMDNDGAQGWLAGAVCSFSLKDPDHSAGSGGYWPFKVLESAALGVPIVLSDAPGLPEMSQALGHALVCRYDDADEVASAVARLHGDPELRAKLVSTGLERVRDYTWEAGAAQLAALL